MKERELFLKAITEKSARSTGQDTRSRRRTTAQRKDEERAILEILRGNCTWGTPIVRGGGS